jgi:peptidoglycan hydrolase CwlO-like protein
MISYQKNVFVTKNEDDQTNRVGLSVVSVSDSLTDNTNQQVVPYVEQQSTVPMITPSIFPPTSTIVNQHHLNRIQRNVFMQTKADALNTHQGIPVQGLDAIISNHEKEKQKLTTKVKELEQRLTHLQEKHDDQITAYKEKLDETKQDLREARQSAKFIEAINGRQSCIIS